MSPKLIIGCLVAIAVIGGGLYFTQGGAVPTDELSAPDQVVRSFLLEANASTSNLESAIAAHYSSKALATIDEIKNKTTAQGKIASGLFGGYEGMISTTWKTYTKSGSIQDVRILNTDIDGTQATVRLEITYTDGTTKIDDYILLQEEGVWKIDKQG